MMGIFLSQMETCLAHVSDLTCINKVAFEISGKLHQDPTVTLASAHQTAEALSRDAFSQACMRPRADSSDPSGFA